MTGKRLVVCEDCGATAGELDWKDGTSWSEPGECPNCGHGVGEVYTATGELVGADAAGVADVPTEGEGKTDG